MVMAWIKNGKLEGAVTMVVLVPSCDHVLQLVDRNIPILKRDESVKVRSTIISATFFDPWPSMLDVSLIKEPSFA